LRHEAEIAACPQLLTWSLLERLFERDCNRKGRRRQSV
jgi:hypothetical protein